MLILTLGTLKNPLAPRIAWSRVRPRSRCVSPFGFQKRSRLSGNRYNHERRRRVESASFVRVQTLEVTRAGQESGGRNDRRRIRTPRATSAQRRRERRGAGPVLAGGLDERFVGPDGRLQVRRPQTADADDQTELGVRHGRRTAQPNTVDTVCGARQLRLLAHNGHQRTTLLDNIRKASNGDGA